MDVKAEVEKLVKKIGGDEKLKAKFAKDPAGAVKDILGTAVPEETAAKIVDGVKAKFTADKLSSAAAGVSKLFGK
jgi:hypothetical protein